MWLRKQFKAKGISSVYMQAFYAYFFSRTTKLRMIQLFSYCLIFLKKSDLTILIRHTHSSFTIDEDLLQRSSNTTFYLNFAEIILCRDERSHNQTLDWSTVVFEGGRRENQPQTPEPWSVWKSAPKWLTQLSFQGVRGHVRDGVVSRAPYMPCNEHDKKTRVSTCT